MGCRVQGLVSGSARNPENVALSFYSTFRRFRIPGFGCELRPKPSPSSVNLSEFPYSKFLNP